MSIAPQAGDAVGKLLLEVGKALGKAAPAKAAPAKPVAKPKPSGGTSPGPRKVKRKKSPPKR